MIDDRTTNLSLPLPHADNSLLEDVGRLRSAIAGADAAIESKQDGLVSGANIKTIGGLSLLGSGDLDVVGGLSPTPIKTLAYTAAVNDLVRIDSATGSFTVTLPPAPLDGEKVGILDVRNACSTYPVFIAVSGGKTIEWDASGLSINISGAFVELMCIGSNWKILNTPVFGSYQELLVSGQNIKTVNGSSLLGSGNLTVGGVAVDNGYDAVGSFMLVTREGGSPNIEPNTTYTGSSLRPAALYSNSSALCGNSYFNTPLSGTYRALSRAFDSGYGTNLAFALAQRIA